MKREVIVKNVAPHTLYNRIEGFCTLFDVDSFQVEVFVTGTFDEVKTRGLKSEKTGDSVFARNFKKVDTSLLFRQHDMCLCGIDGKDVLVSTVGVIIEQVKFVCEE